MNNSRCLYPGSFDPVTLGHLDIIRRAAAIFDTVVVGVLHNPEKKGCFSVEQRVDMLQRACQGIPNVEVISYGGLLAQLTKETGISVVVRGVRGAADLENETAMARVNHQLNPALETMFMPASPEKVEISASVRARRTPAFARSGRFRPRFCPTKVVEARAMDCMGRNSS